MRILILLVVFFQYSCLGQIDNTPVENIEQAKTDSLPSKEEQKIQSLASLSVVGNMDYLSVKKSIQKDKLQLKTANIDSLSHLFEHSLLLKIIPFWEGTPWSFEGHTAVPNSGEIACGYFVSTTLQDIGLNINRYKLAQQSPINEAKTLAIDMPVKGFSGSSAEGNISQIKEYLPEGIHFIGFDMSHVGYILKKNNSLYLIHSNYLDARGVVIEPIEKSEVFKSYLQFYLVELSSNKTLLTNWINNVPISVVMK